MASKIPVLTTSNSALKEHSHKKAHHIDDNCENLKDLFINTISNDFRNQYVEEAYLYSKKFNWDDISLQTKSLYNF